MKYGYRRAAAGLICILIAMLFPLKITVAADQGSSTRISTNSIPLSPRSAQDQVAQLGNETGWTLSVGGIALGRLGAGVNRTLVTRVPGSVPFLTTSIAPGTEAFNSNRFQQGMSAGPRAVLTYRDASGYGAEFSYFNLVNQSATVSFGPYNPADWLVMKAPGGFWQTQDFPYQAMTWRNSTNLYGAEINGRYNISRRLTLLAGLRWLQLNDSLRGTLTPADRTSPVWKTTCPLCDLSQVTSDEPIGVLPPFWNAAVTNNLYGVQLGLDGRIWELDRFSFDGRVMGGLFDNVASQSSGVSIRKIVYPATATTNSAAFVGEASLRLNYGIMGGLSVKASYEVLWLVGIALAPGQIEKTYTAPSGVRALGVNHGSNALFHGVAFGLEYSF